MLDSAKNAFSRSRFLAGRRGKIQIGLRAILENARYFTRKRQCQIVPGVICAKEILLPLFAMASG
jgi:hypothetical protein